jgi:hypothetical protein
LRSLLLRGAVTVAVTGLTAVTVAASATASPSQFAPSGSADSSVVTDQSDVTAVAVEDRTETSTTYLQSDGSYKTEILPQPIRYKSSTGEWRPIDNTLVGSDRPGYAVENAQNDYSLLIPSDAGNLPVRFGADGEWVSFAAERADGAPEVEDNAASIGGLGPDARLEYEATSTGVKETVVLDAPPVDSSWEFDLDTSAGVTPQLTSDGGLDFVNESGEVTFSVPAPFMTDNSGDYSDAVSFDLSNEGEGWQLTMTAEPSWLGDPARVYPVRVDPTISTIDHAADCWISYATPDTPNCGAGSDWIRAGSVSGNGRRALLNFNLEGIPATVVEVTKADLSLHVDPTQTTDVRTAEYVARRVTQDWTGQVTWKNYDGTSPWATAGGDFQSSTLPGIDLNGSTSAYRTFDVTPIVDGWLTEGDLDQGFIVKQRYEDVDSVVGFFSSNSSNPSRWPKLTVTYEELEEVDEDLEFAELPTVNEPDEIVDPSEVPPTEEEVASWETEPPAGPTSSIQAMGLSCRDQRGWKYNITRNSRNSFKGVYADSVTNRTGSPMKVTFVSETSGTASFTVGASVSASAGNAIFGEIRAEVNSSISRSMTATYGVQAEGRVRTGWTIVGRYGIKKERVYGKSYLLTERCNKYHIRQTGASAPYLRRWIIRTHR